MKKVLMVAGTIAIVGYAAIRLVDRGLLNFHGDPSTVDGYIKRFVEHEFSVELVREGQAEFAANDLRLVGQLFNGGDRALGDVVIRVDLARTRDDPPESRRLNLGRFQPMQHRWIDQRLTSWSDDGVWFEIEVESVVLLNDA